MIFQNTVRFLRRWFQHVFGESQPASLHNLYDPKRYEQQIQKMLSNARNKGQQHLLKSQHRGVSLFAFGIHQHKVARYLARSLRKESFILGTARQRLIASGKNGSAKSRVIYEFSLPDKIVSSVLAQLLTELAEPLHSAHTYAFRSGMNTLQVAKAFANYLRKSYLNSPQLKGMYLIKTDIVNYSDQINLKENSPLWSELGKMFVDLNITVSPYQWQFIQSCIRPVTMNLEHRLQSSICGIPTGTSMNVFLCNFYTMIIDRNLATLDGIFYARYCDDILLAHPDPEILRKADALLTKLLLDLGLSRQMSKDLFCYLSKAGNKSPDPMWQGANKFLHLGYRISGDGQFAISKLQQRGFFRDLQKRIENCYRNLGNLSWTEQGKIICTAINHALTDRIFSKPQALTLIRDGADEAQLKHLDYVIALKIAETVSGRKGPRAFRDVPYRTIRGQWGLLSLLQLKLRSNYLSR